VSSSRRSWGRRSRWVKRIVRLVASISLGTHPSHKFMGGWERGWGGCLRVANEAVVYGRVSSV
jgi:hypothetical protein